MLASGQRFARRYRLGRKLGEGGAGEVYRAVDELTGGEVALKVAVASGPEHVAAFHRELELLTQAFHPRIARVLDFGVAALDERTPFSEGAAPPRPIDSIGPHSPSLGFAEPAPLRGTACYQTSELVDGVRLDAYATGRSWAEVERGIGDVLAAVKFLHGLGVRHNDLTPANAIVDRAGRATLLDLGCAGPLETKPSSTVSGTPGFVAPELLRGDAGDARADLFGLGTTLRRLCDRLSGVPPAVHALVARLTADDPRERPSDADEVIEALGLAIDPPSFVRAPFVGRAKELGAARELIERVAGSAAAPRTLAFHGPRDAGKTRLLTELKWRAQLRATVVEGSAHRGARELLERATDGPLDGDPIAMALAARDRLAGERAAVLLLDDADLLAGDERALFEAFAASIEDADPIALVYTSTAPVPGGIALSRFGATEVEALGAALDPRACAELATRAEGLPGAVLALLDARASSGGSAGVLALGPSARSALALLVASGGRLDEGVLHDDPALEELRERGWTVRDGGVRLARLGDLARIEAALPRVDRVAAHRRLAETAEPIERIRHLAAAGQAEAGVLFRAELGRHEPRALADAALALGENAREAETLLACAEILELAGDPHAGMRVIARLRKLGGARRDLYARAGSIALKLGNARGALRHLRRAEPAASDGSRATWSAVCARARLQANEPGPAKEHAEAALRAIDAVRSAGADASLDALEAGTATTLGLALAYLGELDAGRRALGRAKALEQALPPRERVRLSSYRAVVEYRAGELAVARGLYREALDRAETAGVSDQIPSVLSSLAALDHRRGDFGQALAGYERARRYARAARKIRTVVSLDHNRAQAFCDIGLFDRAKAAAERTRALAERHGLPFFVSAAELVAGEIALHMHRDVEAREHLARAEAGFASSGAVRESLDAQLTSCELEQRGGAGERARLDALVRDARAIDARDLVARALLLSGRFADGPRARELFEEARAGAEVLGMNDLAAECLAALAGAYRSERAEHAARACAERALELWDRCAASLDAPFRDAFFAHPRRRLERPAPARDASGREQFLERVLAVNSRINQSLRIDDVLTYTMDAAVDLAGAERGFVILRNDAGELDVRVARNLDRERVDRAYLKFSRTIAERVIESGEALVTTDAAADDRFAGERSVQALRLRSILCVPIRAAGATAGALYLENRFERGRFERESIRDLLAFADQVGIALANARLYAELEAERVRIAALLERRTHEVDQLSREVRLERSARGERDTRLVGRSAAMDELRTLIDRVRDAPVTVLVHGESGSGKELVARAIHGDASAERPFVSVSCAALPETLLESELFGYVRGAFTGADRDREGLFSLAGRGTLFLDEVGEIPLGMQAKLLRAIQEREIRALGASKSVPIEARIVSATNRRLEEEVRQGRFREDLFYRLAVVQIPVPPLRARIDDLVVLSRHILSRLAAELGRPAPRLAPKALEKLARHAWPGNVRELENALANAMVLGKSAVLGPDDLFLAASDRARVDAPVVYESAERARLLSSLEETRWNVSEVARALSIPRATLYRKLKRYGLARR